MDVPTLPPRIVVFLNALYHQSEVTQAWEGFQEELSHAWLWLEVHGAYAVCAEEESLLENLGYLLGEVEDSLQARSSAAILDRLRPALQNAFSLMHHILSERRRLALAQDECLNDLLLAGTALLRGGAEPAALLERLPLAQDRVACLRGRLGVFSEQLVPEFRTEIEQGLTRLEAALADLAGGGELEEALTRAVGAALYADVFQEWEADWRRQSEQAFCKYAIPHVGADLEDVVARGWELDRSQWGLGIWRLRKVIFPALQAHWEEQRESAILTVAPEEALLPVELGMQELWAALVALTDEGQTATQVLTALEQALQSLSQAYRGFEQARLQRDHLSPTLATYYDAAQGVLGGTVADLHLAELVAEEPLSHEFSAASRCLREYLVGRDPEHLNRALGHIADQACSLARDRERQAAECQGLDRDLLRWRTAACV